MIPAANNDSLIDSPYSISCHTLDIDSNTYIHHISVNAIETEPTPNSVFNDFVCTNIHFSVNTINKGTKARTSTHVIMPLSAPDPTSFINFENIKANNTVEWVKAHYDIDSVKQANIEKLESANTGK